MSDTLMEQATTSNEGEATTEEQSTQTDEQATQTEQTETEAQQGAPEKYEFVAPEGKQFDDEVMNVYSEVMKELDLPQDKAQKILDKVNPILEKRQAEKIEAIHSEWSETSKTDKEFGGEKLQENLSIAKKTLEKYGTPELSELINKSGLGNNPEVIRLFYRVGKDLSTDTFVGGQRSGKDNAPKSTSELATSLYS